MFFKEKISQTSFIIFLSNQFLRASIPDKQLYSSKKEKKKKPSHTIEQTTQFQTKIHTRFRLNTSSKSPTLILFYHIHPRAQKEIKEGNSIPSTRIGFLRDKRRRGGGKGGGKRDACSSVEEEKKKKKIKYNAGHSPAERMGGHHRSLETKS